MKNIVYVGDLNEMSHSRAHYEALKGMGYIVAGINTFPWKFHYANPDKIPFPFYMRLRNRLRMPMDPCHVNYQLRKYQNEADILILEKATMVRPKTIWWFRQKYPACSIWFISNDNPSLLHCTSWYVRHYYPLIDGVVAIKGYDDLALKRLGVKRVIFIDRSYNPTMHYPIGEIFPEDQRRYCCDVAFIGSYEEKRALTIRSLADKGIKVQIFGDGWKDFPEHLNIKNHYRRTLPGEIPKIVACSQICLSFFRKLNQDTSTSRIFEIPAMRGFLLSEYSDQAAQYFEEDKEVAFFRSDQELYEKVRFYLGNPELRQKMVNAAYEKCIGRFSHQSQMASFLNQLLFLPQATH